MMNLRSNISKIAMIGLAAIVFSTYVPATTFAITNAKNKENLFCTNLPSKVTQINTDMNSNRAKVTDSQTNRTQQITSNRDKSDQEIAANRVKWDQERQDNYSKLQAKAETDTQKAAVETYGSIITSAVTVRRAAYDQAKATYRDSVDTVISSRQSQANNQILAFSDAVKIAISTAETSCGTNSSNGAAVRTQFMSDMKNARQTYQDGRTLDGNLGGIVKQLAQDRNASFKAADVIFKTTTEAAKATLKAAFESENI